MSESQGQFKKNFKEKIQNNIGGHNWWCATAGNRKKCNFPFLINGEIHYKPVDEKCITDDTFTYTFRLTDKENPKEFLESKLEPCSPCADSDQDTYGAYYGYAYNGFHLLREPEKAIEEKFQRNDYSCVTLVECQYLCYTTETCLYLNFELK